MHAEQLDLPWFDPRDARAPAIPRPRKVFVNRDLKLAQCDWVGFDMDYTLAIYRQREMDRLSVDATVKKLLERDYPEWLADLDIPLDFPIRGLLVDKLLGNVLKVNRFKVVGRGYHGLRELSRNELRALYDEKKLRHKSTRYHWIDSLYALSEVAVYVAAIEGYESRGQRPRFGKLWNDIRECIDEAHRDGTILDAIAGDLPRFVMRDPELPMTLHKLRTAGKKLFVLTNSRWAFTEKMLAHLLGDGHSDYASFYDYFDAIIVAAKKPAFFQERAPLLERLEDGTTCKAARPLQSGKVYEGGNLRELQAALGAGHRVMYVGDHIYGDIVRSKKDTSWRTALVVQELEDEIEAHQKSREDAAVLGEIQQRHAELEDATRHLQMRAHDLAERIGRGDDSARLRDELTRTRSLLGSIRRQLRNLDRESRLIRRRIDHRFHPHWGPVLKEGSELSLFGAQVDAYACLYTSRVSNLLSYSPHQVFRSPHNSMHHEL